MNKKIFAFFMIFLLSFSLLAVAQDDVTLDVPSDKITDAPESNTLDFMPVSDENLVPDTFWGKVKLFFKRIFNTEQTFYNAQVDLEFEDIPEYCSIDKTVQTSDLAKGGKWATGNNPGTYASMGGQCDIGQYITFEYKDGSWHNIFSNLWYKKDGSDHLSVKNENWMANGIFNDAGEDVLEVRYKCWDCNTQDSCDDSDNGFNYWATGTVVSNIDSDTDVCINNDQLKEYYCDGTNIAWEFIYCSDEDSEAQCSVGKCFIPEPECEDSDGGNEVNTKGTTSKGDTSQTDYCSNTLIVEYYCSNNNIVDNGGVNCPAGKTCEAGACVVEEPEGVYTCQDTDGGIKFNKKGITKVYLDGVLKKQNSDACVQNVDGIQVLSESSCKADQSGYKLTEHVCGEGTVCDGGKCVDEDAEEPACVDPDGENPFIKSAVTIDGVAGTPDSCKSDTVVFENICHDETSASVILIDCEEGATCSNGACSGGEGTGLGCTDELADNFDHSASEDDGSCVYTCTENLDVADDYSVFGTVVFKGVTFTDACDEEAVNNLFEYSCSEDGVIKTVFECEKCEKGACIGGTTEEEETDQGGGGGGSTLQATASQVSSEVVEEAENVVLEEGTDYSKYLVPALIASGLLLLIVGFFVLKKLKIIKFK